MALIGSILLGTAVNTKGLTKGLNKATASLRNFAATLAPIGAGAAFTALLRSGEEFNRAMLNSTAILGDVSDTLRSDMRDAAFEVASATKFGATQAAEAFFFLESAGLSAQQSIGALPQVAEFAQAGNFDLARATDLLTDAQSALGLTVKDTAANMQNMARVSDVLIKANTLANSTAEQFSEALTNKAGAALRIVNKSVEEGVAVLAAFADQGVKGSEAGTALNIVLRDLQTKAIQNASAFREAGIAVFDGAGNMRNIADVVGEVGSALEGMSDSTKKATLLQLGFTDKSIAFLQTLIGTSDKIRTYQEELEKAGGTTAEVADRQLTAFQDGLSTISAALVEFGASFVEAFGPAAAGLLRGFADVLQVVSSAFGVLRNIVEPVFNAITGLTGGVFDLSKAFFRTIAVLVTVKATLLAVAAAEKAVAIAGALVQGVAGPIAWAKLAAGVAAAAITIGVIETAMSGVVDEAQSFNTQAEAVTANLEQIETASERSAMRLDSLREKLAGLSVPLDDVSEVVQGFAQLPETFAGLNANLANSPADRGELLPDDLTKFRSGFDDATRVLGNFLTANGELGDVANGTFNAIDRIVRASIRLQKQTETTRQAFVRGAISFEEFQQTVGGDNAAFNAVFDQQAKAVADFQDRLEGTIKAFGSIEKAVEFAAGAVSKLATPQEEFAAQAAKIDAAFRIGLVTAEQQGTLLASAAQDAAEQIDLAQTKLESLPDPIRKAVEEMQKLDRLEGLESFADKVKANLTSPIGEFIAERDKLKEVLSEGLIDKQQFDAALKQTQDSIKQRLGIPVDPIEQFESRLAELQAALAQGIISQSDFERATAKAEKAIDLPSVSNETQFAGALEAGSAAARSVVLRNRFGLNSPLNDIAQNGKSQLAETKKQTGILQSIASSKTPIKVFSLS